MNSNEFLTIQIKSPLIGDQSIQLDEAKKIRKVQCGEKQ
jgi:hypothetical protein